MHITGLDYPEYTDYTPMAWAVFYSASGGENYIFGNEIIVEDLSLGSKNETSAFYIGGGAIGGQFYDNHITTNVPAAWVASRYGGAINSSIFNNTIVKSSKADSDFKPFRMGWAERTDCIAKGIKFSSNEFEDLSFGIDATDQHHSYSVYWTMTVHVIDKKGKKANGAEVVFLDKNKEEVLSMKANSGGSMQVELVEYSMDDDKISYLSPYTVIVNNKKEKVSLNRNKEITITVK